MGSWYWTFTMWSIDSCQNRIATDQYHISERKNVMSMRELFGPDPLAGFEKMALFKYFFCLKIKCFHS